MSAIQLGDSSVTYMRAQAASNRRADASPFSILHDAAAGRSAAVQQLAVPENSPPQKRARSAAPGARGSAGGSHTALPGIFSTAAAHIGADSQTCENVHVQLQLSSCAVQALRKPIHGCSSYRMLTSCRVSTLLICYVPLFLQVCCLMSEVIDFTQADDGAMLHRAST